MLNSKALRILLRYNIKFRHTYYKLLTWNEQLTSKELSKVFGTSQQNINSIARRYKLKYGRHK